MRPAEVRRGRRARGRDLPSGAGEDELVDVRLACGLAVTRRTSSGQGKPYSAGASGLRLSNRAPAGTSCSTGLLQKLQHRDSAAACRDGRPAGRSKNGRAAGGGERTRDSRRVASLEEDAWSDGPHRGQEHKAQYEKNKENDIGGP
nr:unnamed protein product [Digitaria exilis]